MKKILLFSMTILLLGGCDKINEFKVNYQVSECLATLTVSCTDTRIEQAIFQVKKARQEFIDNKQGAIDEFGEERYQQLLVLIDKKIKHLEDQRPNFFYRWFKGDERYDRDVDYGDAIDAELLQLIHENQHDLSSTQTTAQTTPPETINLTKGEPIGTASEQNNEFVSSPNPSYKYPYYFKITALTSEIEMNQVIYTVIQTTKGKVYFHGQSAWHNGILLDLKVNDCIYFTTDNEPIEKADGTPSFEEYISTPEHVSCDSIQ